MTRTEFHTSLVNHINRAITAVAVSGLLVLIACSSSSRTAGRAASEQSKPAPVAAQQPTQAQPAAAKFETVSAKSSPVVHRASVGTLRNDDFGISLEYPWQYGFKSGHKLRMSGEQIETSFVAPGGINLGVIEIPAGYYPKTDFERAFFSVNVNRKLTSDQCSQFAEGAAKNGAAHEDGKNGASGGIDQKGAEPSAAGAAVEIPQFGNSAIPQLTATKVSVGDEEYLMSESRTDSGILRTYHTYQNNACYEFVLGLKTSDSDGSAQAKASGENNGSSEKTAEIKPVSEKQVFARLEKILATVSITPDGDQNSQAVAAAPTTSDVPPQKP